MILLPRRGILQELLVRQLKRLRVPVAGADRLALIDEIAVMDLAALGDALLLPEDDLTLAAVLKSPLFGLGEEDLFDLAYDRGHASLHDRLRALAGERKIFAEAHERFAGLLAQADFLPPFELYTRLLGEGGGRERFVSRLGTAALEPIEAFLAQALAYERGHPPSLQGFLHWLRADTTELIRDPDRPRDEVRVLTVHGAKGLEAPVVVLADATFVPELNDRLLWLEADGLPLWKVGSARRDRVSAAAHDQSRRRQLEEQRRLLYVAMTRAQEQLIVAGWERKNSTEATWYELITAGLERAAGRAARRDAPCDPSSRGRAGASPRSAPPDRASSAWRSRGPRARRRRPPGSASAAPRESGLARPLSPSHLDEAGPPAASPLDDVDRYRRGRLIHRLLQSLPERPVGERGAAMARFLAQPALALDEALQEEIAAEVLGRARGARDRARLRARLAGGGAAGRRGRADQAIAGQVDRLVVGEHEVLVIDYKTNRAPPATPDQVPAAYLRQMAAYGALLRQIYPDRRVRCALLWTQGPHLMPLDEAALASHAPGAWLVGAGVPGSRVESCRRCTNSA